MVGGKSSDFLYPRTHSEVVKFEHFKMRVMDNLPCSWEFNRISVPYPIQFLITSAARLFPSLAEDISERYNLVLQYQ